MSTISRPAFVGLASLAILAGAASSPAALLAQHGGGHRGGHGGGHGGGQGVALGHGGHGIVGHGRTVGAGHARSHGVVGGHGRVGGHGGGIALVPPTHPAVAHHNAIILHNDVVHHDVFVPHHGLHVGFVIGAPLYPFYFTSYPYSVGYWPYRARYRVAAPAGGAPALNLLIEAAGEGVVRVTWPEGGSGIQEVGLFLADRGQQVLAVQTLRASPFTALFDVVAGTAYVGMTVVYGDGRKVTILAPYAP